MVSIAATTPAIISMKANAPQNSGAHAEMKQLASVKDVVDTVNQKGQDIKNGAKKAEDVAKNIEDTVKSVEKASTSVLASATTAVGSCTAIFGLFTPMLAKAKAIVQKPGIQNAATKILNLSKKIYTKVVTTAKANPKMTIATLGIVAVATAAAVIGKAIVNAKANQPAKAAETPAAEAEPVEKNLDIVSEA